MSDYDNCDNVPILLGEATMNLIDCRKEVNSESLSFQLKQMAVNEKDDFRVIEIWKARKWLLQHSVQNTAKLNGIFSTPDRPRANQSRLQDFRHLPSSNDAIKRV